MEHQDFMREILTTYCLAKKEFDEGKKIENILQQKWYEKEEKKIQETLENGPQLGPFSHPVMTINMNGKGSAGYRKLFLTILLRNCPCSVIFSQEQNASLTQFIAKMCDFKARQNEKEAAVFWKEHKFEGTDEGLKSTDTEIMKIRHSLQSEFKGEIDLSEVLSRIKMVNLTCLVPGKESSFLAVSWHGPHRMTKENKEKTFRGLQEFAKKVSEKEGNIPFIIGGDFNFDTLHENVSFLKNVALTSYPLSPRAEERSKNKNYIPYKDNFLFSYSYILVKGTRPLDLTCDIPVEDMDNLLDHDPVAGLMELSISLSGSSSVDSNLDKKFKALSIK